MSITKRGVPALIDGKQAFILWCELGTIGRVQKHLYNLGHKNLKTGNPLSFMKVWSSAFRWVLNNSEEARDYYIKDEAGFALDDDQWNLFLISRACTVYADKKRFFEWIDRMGFGDKYVDAYVDRYGARK